jgi:hypothetical protein
MMTASTISEYVEAVKQLSVETGWYWWYRGQPDASWDLQPGVHRKHSVQEELYLSNLKVQPSGLYSRPCSTTAKAWRRSTTPSTRGF